MKNAFKLGFLGLALTVAFASCNNTEKKGEGAADSVSTDSAAAVIDSAAVTVDSAAAVVDSAATAVDSAAHAH